MSSTHNTHSLHNRIVGLTAFLDAFESPEFTFGSMDYTPGVMPFYEFSETASRFIETAYDLGWVLTDFDWSSWDEGQRFVDDLEALGQADLADIERILTAHIRQDRFCEGHLGAMYEAGHLTAILRRLKAIRQEVET